jgi:hypothetical protein
MNSNSGKTIVKTLVYKENPFLALVPKDESPDGFAGKYGYRTST